MGPSNSLETSRYRNFSRSCLWCLRYNSRQCTITNEMIIACESKISILYSFYISPKYTDRTCRNYHFCLTGRTCRTTLDVEFSIELIINISNCFLTDYLIKSLSRRNSEKRSNIIHWSKCIFCQFCSTVIDADDKS